MSESLQTGIETLSVLVSVVAVLTVEDCLRLFGLPGRAPGTYLSKLLILAQTLQTDINHCQQEMKGEGQLRFDIVGASATWRTEPT